MVSGLVIDLRNGPPVGLVDKAANAPHVGTAFDLGRLSDSPLAHGISPVGEEQIVYRPAKRSFVKQKRCCRPASTRRPEAPSLESQFVFGALGGAVLGVTVLHLFSPFFKIFLLILLLILNI